MKQLLLMLVAAGVALGAQPEYLISDHNGGKVLWVNTKGEVIWTYDKAPASCDCQALPNGNVLLAYRGGALELTKDKQVVWEWKAKPGEEVYTVQRLDNGDTMVGELGAIRLIEVAPDGKTIKKEVKLPIPAKIGQHGRWRNARKLANGHYLFASLSEAIVKEIDDQGTVVWSVKCHGNPFCAVRLNNGNTLVGCGDGHRIQEFDKDGKLVWEVKDKEPTFTQADGTTVPVPLQFVAALERLPNGNTIVTNYLGHGSLGKGAHIFELTPDKKVLWQNDDHKQFKACAGCCVIGVDGLQR